MLVLKGAGAATIGLDQTEPVYPTGGHCEKRRGCKGPATVQGEPCPRCGVEFGGNVGAADGPTQGYYSQLRPPSSFPTRTVVKWSGECEWPEHYTEDPIPVLEEVVEHFDPNTGERVCGAGRR